MKRCSVMVCQSVLSLLIAVCSGLLSGLLELNHGDVIFVRDKHRPEAENDIPIGWVFNACVLPQLHKSEHILADL